MQASLVVAAGVTVRFEVRNLAAAIRWYADKLGLGVRSFQPDQGWAELDLGITDTSVGLHENPSRSNSTGTMLTLAVADLEAAKARLGPEVSVRGPFSFGEGRHAFHMIFFSDPDGNQLAFRECAR